MDNNEIKEKTSGIWNKIEETMKEIYDYSKKAIEKTSEYGKIGVKTVELKMLKSSAQQLFTELGNLSFKLLYEDKKENLSLEDKEVNDIITKLIEIDKEIDEKEAEIEELKKEDENNKEAE